MYYAVSDIHLGAGSREEQRTTESLFVEWLDSISGDVQTLFLCGDIFDFWFEYSRVVPKGFVRSLSKIASLTDRGVRVVFMSGNHDMWVRDYLATECGVEIYTAPTTFDVAGKSVHIAHGDNLNIGKGNLSLKLMNSFFRSRFARWCFRHFVHPDLGMCFGQWWSSKSRKGHLCEDESVVLHSLGFLKEYAAQHYAAHKADLYIFGHLHHAGDYTNECPATIFTNDWHANPKFISITSEGEVSLCDVKQKIGKQ